MGSNGRVHAVAKFGKDSAKYLTTHFSTHNKQFNTLFCITVIRRIANLGIVHLNLRSIRGNFHVIKVGHACLQNDLVSDIKTAMNIEKVASSGLRLNNHRWIFCHWNRGL